MFFSFEGIDGSGKSTQAHRLSDALRQRGHSVVNVREPGGTALGERVRPLLLDPLLDVSPKAELLLFLSARAQLVRSVIEPALADGAIVIADRFVDSSEAYQGGGRSIRESAPVSIADLNAFATGGLQPRRTYLVDLNPVSAAQRRSARRPADRMESGGEAFFDRVRASYLALASSHPDRIVVVDGSEGRDEISAVILQDALALLSDATKRAPPLQK